MQREKRGLPRPTPLRFKWTGNANMATVGEWKRSGVQATGSAGGRLSVGGVSEEEEEEGGDLLGWQDCTNILSHYPDSFITPVMYGREKLSDGFTPAVAPHLPATLQPRSDLIKPAPSQTLNTPVRFR